MLQFVDEAAGTPWMRGTVSTPVGALALVWAGEAVVAASFGPEARAFWFGRRVAGGPVPAWLAELVAESLRRGLGHAKWSMLDPGLTPLARLAWQAAAEVPSGRLASYGDIARAIGRPRTARAVGAAMRRSTADLLIPTHRIVRHDGTPAPSQRGGVGDRLRAWERRAAGHDASRRAGSHRSPVGRG
jgi:O-6-methylguanine DNA methyltransferase